MSEPEREALRGVVGGVLTNATNYPKQVGFHVLGRDMGPLIIRAVDAVIAAGYVLPMPPPFKCEVCGYPTEDAADEFWCCSLCGSLDYEPNAPTNG